MTQTISNIHAFTHNDPNYKQHTCPPGEWTNSDTNTVGCQLPRQGMELLTHPQHSRISKELGVKGSLSQKVGTMSPLWDTLEKQGTRIHRKDSAKVFTANYQDGEHMSIAKDSAWVWGLTTDGQHSWNFLTPTVVAVNRDWYMHFELLTHANWTC